MKTQASNMKSWMSIPFLEPRREEKKPKEPGLLEMFENLFPTHAFSLTSPPKQQNSRKQSRPANRASESRNENGVANRTDDAAGMTAPEAPPHPDPDPHVSASRNNKNPSGQALWDVVVCQFDVPRVAAKQRNESGRSTIVAENKFSVSAEEGFLQPAAQWNPNGGAPYDNRAARSSFAGRDPAHPDDIAMRLFGLSSSEQSAYTSGTQLPQRTENVFQGPHGEKIINGASFLRYSNGHSQSRSPNSRAGINVIDVDGADSALHAGFLVDQNAEVIGSEIWLQKPQNDMTRMSAGSVRNRAHPEHSVLNHARQYSSPLNIASGSRQASSPEGDLWIQKSPSRRKRSTKHSKPLKASPTPSRETNVCGVVDRRHVKSNPPRPGMVPTLVIPPVETWSSDDDVDV